MKTYEVPQDSRPANLPPTSLRMRKPRRYAKWKRLRQWEMIPPWEVNPPGFLLREARESAGFTRQRLASLLGCSQQAISMAEHFDSNPTPDFANAWMSAVGLELQTEPTNLFGHERK